jgi:hypothetical protein
MSLNFPSPGTTVTSIWKDRIMSTQTNVWKDSTCYR